MATFETLQNDIYFLFHLKKDSYTLKDRLFYIKKKDEFLKKFHASREDLTCNQILQICDLLEVKRIF